MLRKFTVLAAAVGLLTVGVAGPFGIVTDVSVERKSPSPIVATCDVESFDQAPMEWGWLRA